LTNKRTGYYLGNGHISFWAMPPMSQPLVAKPVASKSFTALYCKDNGSHLPVGEDKDSPGKDDHLDSTVNGTLVSYVLLTSTIPPRVSLEQIITLFNKGELRQIK
jgi:hypothetical protein